MGARGGTTGVSRKSAAHPATPDGRYFVVRGRLWRLANPALDEDVRAAFVSDLMQARRAVRDARENGDVSAEREAHAAVDIAKRGLGERGPSGPSKLGKDSRRLTTSQSSRRHKGPQAARPRTRPPAPPPLGRRPQQVATSQGL